MTISKYEFGDNPCKIKGVGCRYNDLVDHSLRDRDKMGIFEREIEKLKEINKEQKEEVNQQRTKIDELQQKLEEAESFGRKLLIEYPDLRASGSKPYGWRSFKEDGPPPADKYSEVLVEQAEGYLSIQSNRNRRIDGWSDSVRSWIPLPDRGYITPKSPISGRLAWLDRGGQLETDKGE